MPFPLHERAALLCVRRVSSTLVSRLEEMGFESLRMLSQANALEIIARATATEHLSGWKNSGQSRAGIQEAISFAQAQQGLVNFEECAR